MLFNFSLLSLYDCGPSIGFLLDRGKTRGVRRLMATFNSKSVTSTEYEQLARSPQMQLYLFHRTVFKHQVLCISLAAYPMEPVLGGLG